MISKINVNKPQESSDQKYELISSIEKLGSSKEERKKVEDRIYGIIKGTTNYDILCISAMYSTEPSTLGLVLQRSEGFKESSDGFIPREIAGKKDVHPTLLAMIVEGDYPLSAKLEVARNPNAYTRTLEDLREKYPGNIIEEVAIKTLKYKKAKKRREERGLEGEPRGYKRWLRK